MGPDTDNHQPTDDFGYLCRIQQIQDLAFRRLLDGSRKMLPEVADLCEDIANLYLNVAENIRSDAAATTGKSDPEAARPQSDVRCLVATLLAGSKD